MPGGLALSTGDGTKYFFNLDYEPLHNLRSAILGATGAILETLPQPKHKSLAKTSVPDAIQATIKDILKMKLPPSGNGWFWKKYNSSCFSHLHN